VAIVGLGGVGSWAAEALCRSGIGKLVLIDLDDICISNTNRQLHATSSTIGRLKIEEMQKRLLDINPHCNVSLIHEFISAENVHEVIGNLGATVLLDMIDGSREKSALLAACADLKLPVVTCGGAAGRKDPTKIVCDDITEVTGDKLLATCRKELRKYYGFGRGLSFQEKRKNQRKSRKWNIVAVFSTEPQKSLPAGSNLGSSFRRCDGALGTACFVTGAYGFAAAARVVDMIVEGRVKPPRR
jgi:tRNA A37 threonylcarbamoyladenosine dehydratase